MNYKRLTAIILVSVTILLIGYDIFAAMHGNDSTISLVIQTISNRHAIIPFAFGVLMGHFFWQD